MAAHDPSKRSISAEALARYLNTSIRTARRVWAEARADYERRGTARSAPWETEGISRASWYRRRARNKAPVKSRDTSSSSAPEDRSGAFIKNLETSD